MNLPILYRNSSVGADLQWEISTEGPVIITTYGQVGGKLQTTQDTIREGKNLGKANATTATEQAEAEAQATWTKKLKRGYVQSLDDARAGETDSVIEGGVLPMLAPSKSYPTDPNAAKKIVFPAYVQPKLDGVRCVAMISGGTATLWSRTRKPILSVPHIVNLLETAFPSGEYVFDGELYNHDWCDSFEDLMSKIRQSKPMPGHEDVQYHIYDMVVPGTFPVRYQSLQKAFAQWTKSTGAIVLVETRRAINKDEVLALQEHFEELGYEGAMLRNSQGQYEGNRRSPNLQKLKSFVDDEFDITDANEGRGRDEGTVGAFVCRTAEGKVFKARLKASWETRRALWENPGQWKGKRLTVTYKRMTADGLPYIPIGKAIREDY